MAPKQRPHLAINRRQKIPIAQHTVPVRVPVAQRIVRGPNGVLCADIDREPRVRHVAGERVRGYAPDHIERFAAVLAGVGDHHAVGFRRVRPLTSAGIEPDPVDEAVGVKIRDIIEF